MTALTMPARPEEDDVDLRPVPWRRMAWVTWRQHRFALGGAAVLLGGVALYLWLTGLQMHHAYATVAACHRQARTPARTRSSTSTAPTVPPRRRSRPC